jgi:hypothetical protein
VAILFMCEVDNITYSLFLSERVRSRVEDAGRVELSDAEVAALVRTKVVHLVFLVVAVMASTLCAPLFGLDGTAARFLILAVFAANIGQAFQPGATPAEVGIQVGKKIGSSSSAYSGSR